MEFKVSDFEAIGDSLEREKKTVEAYENLLNLMLSFDDSAPISFLKSKNLLRVLRPAQFKILNDRILSLSQKKSS